MNEPSCPEPSSIERIPELEDEAASELRLSEFVTPTIIRGGCTEWRARSSWTDDLLSDRLAGLTMSVYEGWSPPLSGELTQPRSVRASEVLNGKTSGYTEPVPLLRLPGLLDDVRIPTYARIEALSEAHLWLGRAGTTTPLHYDLYYNVLGLIRGAKRVWSLPATALSAAMLGTTSSPPRRRTTKSLSSGGVLDPGTLSRCGPHLQVGDILSGDILVVPPMQFHEVASTEDSISCSFSFLAAHRTLLQPTIARDIAAPGYFDRPAALQRLLCGPGQSLIDVALMASDLDLSVVALLLAGVELRRTGSEAFIDSVREARRLAYTEAGAVDSSLVMAAIAAATSAGLDWKTR